MLEAQPGWAARIDADLAGARLRGQLVLAALLVLLAGFGLLLASWTGLFLVSGATLLLYVGLAGASERLALASLRARPIHPAEAPQVYALLDELATRAGIPTPPLYLSALPVPNAMALGRDPQRALVVVTAPLAQLLTRRELAGVLAHEVAHIAHRDIAATTLALVAVQAIAVAASLVRALALVALGFWLVGLPVPLAPTASLGLVLASALVPWAAWRLRAALGRANEYAADTAAVALTGDAAGLASGLARVEALARRHERWARLLGVDVGRPPPTLADHPPTEERLARLGRAMDWPVYQQQPQLRALKTPTVTLS